MGEFIEPEFVVDPANLHSCSIWKNEKCEKHPKYDIVNAMFDVSVTHQKTPTQFAGLDLELHASIVLATGDLPKGEPTLDDISKVLRETKKPWLVWLCGGPGAANPPNRCSAFNDPYIEKGYVILYLDYRGTGQSISIKGSRGSSNTALEAAQTYMRFAGPVKEHPTEELKTADIQVAGDLFIQLREDNIVRDLEAIRQCLMASRLSDQRKWTLFGQSYGGWISISYLSLYPEGLETIFMTAGLAPITVGAVEANKCLFETVIPRNDEYYTRYPEDVKRVNAIVRFFIDQKGKTIELPTGDVLSFRRFLCMGRNLGLQGRWDGMHKVIGMFDNDINEHKAIQEDSKKFFEKEDSWKFNDRPLYAILHEAMYCAKGGKSNWAAVEAAKSLEQYQWAVKEDWKPANDQEKIYFSGEMVYPFMFREYKRLGKDVLRLAKEIATRELQPTYDPTRFGAEVPLYAVSYEGDLHVNNKQSENTLNLIKEIRKTGAPVAHKMIGPVDWSKDENGDSRTLEHSSIREHTSDVLAIIWRLEEEGAMSKR